MTHKPDREVAPSFLVCLPDLPTSLPPVKTTRGTKTGLGLFPRWHRRVCRRHPTHCPLHRVFHIPQSRLLETFQVCSHQLHHLWRIGHCYHCFGLFQDHSLHSRTQEVERLRPCRIDLLDKISDFPPKGNSCFSKTTASQNGVKFILSTTCLLFDHDPQDLGSQEWFFNQTCDRRGRIAIEQVHVES